MFLDRYQKKPPVDLNSQKYDQDDHESNNDDEEEEEDDCGNNEEVLENFFNSVDEGKSSILDSRKSRKIQSSKKIA